MLTSRYARRLRLLEARYGIGPYSVPETTVEVIRGSRKRPANASQRISPARTPVDETQDLAAEVEALERRRQELEAEVGGEA